jgi:cysteinyl-tRNA synthetase
MIPMRLLTPRRLPMKKRARAQSDTATGAAATGRMRLAAARARPYWIGRGCLTALICTLAAVCRGDIAAAQLVTTGATVERTERLRKLAEVQTWGCQYLNVNPIDVARSGLDLIVVEPVLDGGTGRLASPAEVRLMQTKPDGGRRLVLAYLSVGAAEEYRTYWNKDWRSHPPAWLGPENADWPHSFSVRYWHPAWRELVIDAPGNALERIMAAGFDGVFLDRVDAYHDWQAERSSARDDMVAFVAELAGKARAKRSDFIVVAQNAEHLLADPRYVATIDAVSKESLLTGLQGPGIWNRAEDVAWSLNHLQPAQRNGLVVLDIEYISDPVERILARERLDRLGFKPFFGSRLLDHLPVTQD